MGVRGAERQLLELLVLRCPLLPESPYRVVVDPQVLDQQAAAAPPEIPMVEAGAYLLMLKSYLKMQLILN